MIRYEKNGLMISFDEDTGAALFSDDRGNSFCQIPSDKHISDVEQTDKDIRFCVLNNDTEIVCSYEIRADETGRYFNLDLHSKASFCGKVCYPPPFMVKSGDREIDAYCEGVAFNVEDDIPFPYERPLFGGAWNSMSFWGIARGKSWIMGAVITNADAYLTTQKNNLGLYETGVEWEDEMGNWGYTRSVRFYIGSGNPITDICLTYRKIALWKGNYKTLAEKADEINAVDKIAGCANVWLWNNDSMDKLYSHNIVYKVPDNEQFALRRSIAEDMKNSGMDNVLWSIFDENFDSETINYIKTLGYSTAYYEVYTDVIPEHLAEKIPETRRKRGESREEYWPGGIIVQKNGELCPAWDLKGTDGRFYPQNRMCDKVAADWAKKTIPKHIVDNKIDGVFMDVAWCRTFECYSAEHPQSRRQAFENKRKVFEIIRDMGIFCGTENGHEEAVKTCDYNEGMMSPPMYRFEDSGRRMTHIYAEESIDEKITKYMLNPKYRVPLWELVYHDCQTSYWYWGDSTNCAPALIKTRDLFDILYGLPSIYSFKADDWEYLKKYITESYHRTVPNARKLRYSRMILFEYLTEDMSVQKTTFDNGTEIIANFSNSVFYYNKKEIESYEALVL